MSIVSPSMVPTGVGLYPRPVASLNHSCAPNALFSFIGSRVLVRAVRPIAVGEEVLVPYDDPVLPTPERVRALWQRYQFICTCPRCAWYLPFLKDRTSPPPDITSFACPKRCDPEAEVPLLEAGEMKCNRCGHVVLARREEVAAPLDAGMRSFDQAIAMVAREPVIGASKVVEALQALDRQRHPLFLSLLSTAIETLNGVGQDREVRTLGARLIDEYQRRFPWHPILANELFCQAKLAMKMDHESRANALSLMRRALVLFEAIYGSDHSLTKEAADLAVELQHDVQLEQSMPAARPSAARITD